MLNISKSINFHLNFNKCQFSFYSARNEAKIGNDFRGTAEARRGGIQHWSSECANTIGQEQYASTHQLSQQQEIARSSQGVRSSL